MKTIPLIFLLLAASMTTDARDARQTVRYTLGMSKPATHLLEVEASFTGLPAGERTLDLLLPVWRPGRYLVLDFAGGVQDFSAQSAGGAALPWHKTEKSVWRIETNGAEAVTVRYRVYADEFTLRTRGLDDEHAFVDGSSVFMFAETLRGNPVELTVHPFGNWHVTTGLEGAGNRFTAPGYDVLADSPLEIGMQHDIPFEVGGVPHILSITGEGNWNADTLVRDMSTIVAMQQHFWGTIPYKRYVFILHCAADEGGGTEHLNSCVMGSRPFVFRNPESYRGFLGLVSHEFFHTWNVKQLRPHGLSPYDYMKENYTQELWIAEGTTSYYGSLFLVRGGFSPGDKALEAIAGSVQGDRQRPGNSREPLTASSFDAWVKFWKGNRQSYNMETDYYDRGEAVSLCLDLEIRRRSRNASSLDDVMRAMLQKYPLGGGGYTVEDFQRVCEERAGGGLEEFFQRHVYGAQPLPWEASLLLAGLHLAPRDSVAKLWLGVAASDAGEKTRITRVLAGSPAYDAGIEAGDELVALNGVRVRSNELTDRLGDFRIGQSVKLTIMRNDRLREFSVTIGASPALNYKLTKEAHPTDLQRSIYQSWLNLPWNQPGAPSK